MIYSAIDYRLRSPDFVALYVRQCKALEFPEHVDCTHHGQRKGLSDTVEPKPLAGDVSVSFAQTRIHLGSQSGYVYQHSEDIIGKYLGESFNARGWMNIL